MQRAMTNSYTTKSYTSNRWFNKEIFNYAENGKSSYVILKGGYRNFSGKDLYG